MGLLESFGRAEFFDVSASGKSLARAGDHDRFDGIVCLGLLQAFDNGLSGCQSQSIDGRVIHGDHGDIAMNCVISTHVSSL